MSRCRNTLKKIHDHAQRRVNHAQQLQSPYSKIRDEIIKELKPHSNHFIAKTSLAGFLGLEGRDSMDSKLISLKIHNKLPPSGSGGVGYLSFQRVKDQGRLAEKMQTDDRDTYDVFGMEIWLDDPQLMKKLVKLENPQHRLRRDWKKNEIPVLIDNHFNRPSKHGYRGIHMNFMHKGSKGKGWKEGLEIQIKPRAMMETYLVTRDPYVVYRELLERVKKEKGKNEQNWSAAERALIYPLRNYINALYEADTYELDLMDMLDTRHRAPVFTDEKGARKRRQRCRTRG